MPTLKKRNVRLIVGPAGSGKTTLAKQFVNSLNRAVILDSDFQEFEAEHFLDVHEFYEYLEENGKADNFRASYTPLDGEQELMFAWAKSIGDHKEATLVLEECDRFPEPESKSMFGAMMKRGRHWGLHMIGISLYPFAINIGLRRAATEIYVFRQHEPADLEWLGKVMAPSVIDQITKLGEYEFIKWTAKTGAIEKGKTKKP